MTDDEFQAAMRRDGVRNGYWGNHLRPWSLDEFWQSYLRATAATGGRA